jgi:hypothetical protein
VKVAVAAVPQRAPMRKNNLKLTLLKRIRRIRKKNSGETLTFKLKFLNQKNM